MTSFVPYDDEDQSEPPPWFSNEPDEPPEEPMGPIWRVLITAGALTTLAILILIPLLRAEILQRRQENLPDAAMERTALQFASAILFGRSEGQAMLFASDESRSQIRDVLQFVLDAPQPSNRARLQISSTPCGRQEADACFTGRIFDPEHAIQNGIRFGLDDNDDDPQVIWVEIDATVVNGHVDQHRSLIPIADLSGPKREA